jgi:probable phosphoglycerate mutase
LTKEFYLVRHGETDWNAQARWQGHTDIPLNALGRAQAIGVAELLRPFGPVAVVASDLSRAHETARIVAAELSIWVAYLDPGLRERSFGCFEGLTREDCERIHPRAWRKWVADRHPPPGAETHEALRARVVDAMRRAAEELREEGPAVVVTHGGALRAIVEAATGQTPAPVKNAAVWRVGWNRRLVGAEELTA